MSLTITTIGLPAKRRLLTWHDDHGGLVLEAATSRGDYAVTNLKALGRGAGYEAHYAPPHQKNVRATWVTLGRFWSRDAAVLRCCAHADGSPYAPPAQRE